MGQRLLGQVESAKHAGDFLDPLAAIQGGNGCVGFLGTACLMDKQVVVALSSDLRQVGYGQHLASLAKSAQQLANHFRGWPTDADVYFIEH